LYSDYVVASGRAVGISGVLCRIIKPVLRVGSHPGTYCDRHATVTAYIHSGPKRLSRVREG